jgi:hypothetical protein
VRFSWSFLSPSTRMSGKELTRCGHHTYLEWLADFPPRRPGFDPSFGNVGFVVDEVALGQVFSEYFGFPCQFSFHRMLHTHLSPGAGTIGQIAADVPSWLSLTPLQEIKKSSSSDTWCEEGRPKAVRDKVTGKASSKITELKQFRWIIQMTDPTSRQRGRPTSIKE